eukprot:7338867-Ditylum_brightwellii.AAC.1
MHKNPHNSDISKWFILKQDYKIHPGQALKNNLKDITLASDNLTNIEAFFNLINLAIGTSIGKSYTFKMYDEMQESDYDIAKTPLPPETHPNCQEATGQLNNLSQILCTHLISNNIIDKESSPTCYNTLQKRF